MPILSDPTDEDTDNDGVTDFYDCYPLNLLTSLDDDEFSGIYQYFIDLRNENVSNREYLITPEKWEDELYDNIYGTISLLPDNLTFNERKIIIDTIVVLEASYLQEKYKSAYHMSDNFISKYITERGYNQKLKPLFTQYPQATNHYNKYLKSFVKSFLAGVNCGLLFAAGDTIATYEYNDSMAYVRSVGKAGEIAAGISKNSRHIESITQTATYRIPDGLDDVNMILSEVKNVKYQGLTNQLKDFLYYSQREGYKFELYVRPNTQISKPLQDLIDASEIILKYLKF
ncbi:MAG: hypothetical protein K5898_00155 [Ruminococcus sp.]|uniref:putative toxin n=1 Tax=Ruminococcus sp. TaxID=41978 RepID=UPI0025D85AEC|nr:putative toxin [Ruminococcus sp.]MCR4793597.1 hypothetical protein [Ruminococcus sp.]